MSEMSGIKIHPLKWIFMTVSFSWERWEQAGVDSWEVKMFVLLRHHTCFEPAKGIRHFKATKATKDIRLIVSNPQRTKKALDLFSFIRLTVYSIRKLTLLLMIIGWSIIIPFARHKNKKNFNFKLQICVACLSARAEADHPSSPHCICFHFPPPPPGVTCFHFLSDCLIYNVF